MLRVDTQPLSGRSQHIYCRSGLHEVACEVGCSLENVLTVVEDEERAPMCEPFGDLRLKPSIAELVHAEDVRHGASDRGVRAQHGQIADEHAVRVPRCNVGCDFGGEAGLADTTGAPQRHQALAMEEVADAAQVRVATDEAARRTWHGNAEGGSGLAVLGRDHRVLQDPLFALLKRWARFEPVLVSQRATPRLVDLDR